MKTGFILIIVGLVLISFGWEILGLIGGLIAGLIGLVIGTIGAVLGLAVGIFAIFIPLLIVGIFIFGVISLTKAVC